MSLLNILDRLSIATNLVEAAFMATHDLGLRDRREDALRTVLDLAGEHLGEIRDELEALRHAGEPRGEGMAHHMSGGDRS